MARKQRFLVCPPLGNMARKQCFLVCPPLGNMARKQCFLGFPRALVQDYKSLEDTNGRIVIPVR